MSPPCLNPGYRHCGIWYMVYMYNIMFYNTVYYTYTYIKITIFRTWSGKYNRFSIPCPLDVPNFRIFYFFFFTPRAVNAYSTAVIIKLRWQRSDMCAGHAHPAGDRRRCSCIFDVSFAQIGVRSRVTHCRAPRRNDM